MDEFRKYLQDNRERLDTDVPADELWENVRSLLHPKPATRILWKWVAAASVLITACSIAFFVSTRNEREQHFAKGNPTKDSSFMQEQLNVADSVIPPSHEQPDELAGAPHIRNDISRRTALEDAGKPIPATTVGFRNTVKAIKKQIVSRKQKAIKPLYGFEGLEASYATMLEVQLKRIRTQPIYAEKEAYFDFFKKQFADLNSEEEKLKQSFREAKEKDMLLEELIAIYQQKINVLKQLQFEINKMNNKVKQAETGILLLHPSYIKL